MKFYLRWRNGAACTLLYTLCVLGACTSGNTDGESNGAGGGGGNAGVPAAGASGYEQASAGGGGLSLPASLPGGQAGESPGGEIGQSAGGGGGQAGQLQTGGSGAFGGAAGGGASGAGGTGGAIERPPVGPGAVPSAACGAMAASPDGKHMVVVNGKERTFLVRVPRAYDGKHPYRAIFMFHGGGETSDEFDRAWWFRRDIGEFVVLVLPDALFINNNAAMTSWTRNTADDLAFFDAMLAYIKQRLCFDTTRVFSGGLSSGGFFSNTLGCQRGNVLRGIAPVSAGLRDMNNCKGNVAAWIANGKNDDLVNPSQGMAARDFWLNRNQCSASNPKATGDATGCVAYGGCVNGSAVQWCLHDGGHFWPRSANLGLWNFFSKL